MAFGHHVKRAKQAQAEASRDLLEQFMLEQEARIRSSIEARRPQFDEEMSIPYPDVRECHVTIIR